MGNPENSLQPLPWTGLFALLLSTFAITVGYGVILPILPFMIERLTGTSNSSSLASHTGMLSGTYVIAIFIFAPLWGLASDRWGRQPLILLGLIGFAGSVILFAFVETIIWLYAGRFLGGMFAAAITPASYALIGDHAPSQEWRARRFALISVAGAAGFFIGPLLGSVVLQLARDGIGASAAFAAPFMATSALAILAALTVIAALPRPFPRNARATPPPSRRLGQAVVVRLWAIGFLTAAAVGAFEVGLSLWGKQILGLDPAHIGRMFAECSLVMLIVQALVFSPLIKPEWTRWFLTPGLAILGIGLIVVPLSDTSFTMSVAVAFVAASAGILSPIVTYWVSLGAGEAQGADLGRLTAATSLGQALGSAIGGLVFDVSFIANATFTLTAVFVLAGLMASVGLPALLANIKVKEDNTRQ